MKYKMILEIENNETLQDPLIISEIAKELFIIPVSMNEPKPKIITQEQCHERIKPSKNQKQDLKEEKKYNFSKYLNQ